VLPPLRFSLGEKSIPQDWEKRHTRHAGRRIPAMPASRLIHRGSGGRSKDRKGFLPSIPAGRMSEIPDHNTLLDEIELRQDDLLRELDDLNGRIEAVLREQSAAMGLPYANANPADQPSIAAIQVPGFVNGAQQPQADHQAHEAA
jgi:hypothetical protein